MLAKELTRFTDLNGEDLIVPRTIASLGSKLSQEIQTFACQLLCESNRRSVIKYEDFLKSNK